MQLSNKVFIQVLIDSMLSKSIEIESLNKLIRNLILLDLIRTVLFNNNKT